MRTSSGQRVIEIIGGIRVVCPVGDRLITPYVLEEQGDWFEDEIRFMRTIIAPDGRFIDIGANYGLYTLSAAKLSPQGHVWAYEPARATAACLGQSIAANRFDNVTLTQQAMSDHQGSGWLADKGASELGALASATDSGPGEAIRLTTLDDERRIHDWTQVDIVKIDVEGHEASVIAGGRDFFTTTSPLVMLEIKGGASVDLEAVDRLIALGYHCFRLVPGLQALASQDPAAAMDDYQLNMFCCKPDRAEQLARANRLVRATNEEAADHGGAEDAWRGYIGAFPHARSALDEWTNRSATTPLDGWDTYRGALNLYGLAMDPGQPIAVRYRALRESHARLQTLLKTRATAPRLMSFARIATDLGARRHAVETLSFLLGSAGSYQPADLMREPWLSPSAEFDRIPPHGPLHEWAFSAVLEAFERLRGFSSFFVDSDTTLAVTTALAQAGYLTPAMQRRTDLARRRK